MRDYLWQLLLEMRVEISVIWLMMTGAIGRLFVSSKAISVRTLIGELLLSIVAAIALLSYADMSEWSTAQTVFVGAAVSWLGRMLVLAYLEKKVL